jgi:hypothetical protein
MFVKLNFAIGTFLAVAAATAVIAAPIAGADPGCPDNDCGPDNASVAIPGADANAGRDNAGVNIPGAGANADRDNADVFVPGANANAGPGHFNGCISAFCWNTG